MTAVCTYKRVCGQGVHTRLFTSAERQSLHSCGRERYSKQTFTVIGQLGRQTWWVLELSFWQLSSWSSLTQQVSGRNRQQCSQLPSINTHFTTCYRCITWALALIKWHTVRLVVALSSITDLCGCFYFYLVFYQYQFLICVGYSCLFDIRIIIILQHMVQL